MRAIVPESNFTQIPNAHTRDELVAVVSVIKSLCAQPHIKHMFQFETFACYGNGNNKQQQQQQPFPCKRRERVLKM